MIRIENWSVQKLLSDFDGSFVPPEFNPTFLVGEVFGHARFDDGERVKTSPIASVDGSTVTTESGQVYELGKPNPRYIEWCQTRNLHVPTADEPLRLLQVA